MPKKDPCSYALVMAIIVSFSISWCILHNDATENLSRKLAEKFIRPMDYLELVQSTSSSRYVPAFKYLPLENKNPLKNTHP